MKRSGFSLKEMLIAVAIIAVLLAILVPLVRVAKESSNRKICQRNLQQWGLSVLNYESGHMQLPMGVGYRGRGVTQSQPYSGFVAAEAFIESHSMIFDELDSPTVVAGVNYPAFGVPLSESKYWLWEMEIDLLNCPSAERSESAFGRTSYAFSLGDVARNVSQQKTLRGAYGYFKANPINVFTDGTSNTIGLIEIGGGKTKTVRGGCWMDGKAAWLDDPGQVLSSIKNGNYPTSGKTIGRGSHWADGRAGVGLANTILPPNSPSFQVKDSPTDDGIYSASSMHAGGVYVAFIDGSVHFISEEIDAGDSSTPTLTQEQMEAEGDTVSPHGVWGALGTIGSADFIDWSEY
ncbi:DUF1559 domain-containing protein [Mariniblastus sp.]|nr:DUF1559 domain-containing protein [Mariniblastus sp.]